jgi:hypothetical protein
VAAHGLLDRVAAEPAAGAGHEQRVGGRPPRLVSQVGEHGLGVVSGTVLCFRPVPSQRTWAPVPTWMSPVLSAISSDTRDRREIQ